LRNHVYSTNVILVSKKFWDKLSPTEQKTMKDAFVEAREYQRKVSVEAAKSSVDALKAAGMEFNEISPAERDRMRQVVKPVVDKFQASYRPAIQKLFASEAARVQAIK